MSLFSKALMFLATALVAFSFASKNPPNWDAELIFDDFNDIYGDPINRTSLGAIKSFGDNPGSYTKGTAGYWYVYAGGTAMVTNPGGEELSKTNIATAFDKELGCLHCNFAISENEDYCAIAANLVGEKVYVDLSKMTAVSLKAKGSGVIRMYFETKEIADNYDWGHLGAEITLTTAWKAVDIAVSKLVPAPYSDAETDGVTWADCKAGVTALAFEAAANADGDKLDAEIFLDSIVFKGMKYSDIITPVSVRSSARPANLSSGFSVSQNSINYTIAQPRNLNFSVLNLKGSVVRKIYSNGRMGSNVIMLPANLTTGNYLVKMNGTNAAKRVNIVK